MYSALVANYGTRKAGEGSAILIMEQYGVMRKGHQKED
jgi:hypothetical protein